MFNFAQIDISANQKWTWEGSYFDNSIAEYLQAEVTNVTFRLLSVLNV